MSAVNRSVISARMDDKQKNVTPADVYEREDVYIYSLVNYEDQSNEYVVLKDILTQLSNETQNITFSCERKAHLKGLWSDTRNVALNKAYKTRSAGTLTIPNFDKSQLKIDEAYLFTTDPLEDYVQTDGTVQEVPTILWWIPTGKIEKTKNGNVIFELQTMNSFDWQSQDGTINKIINLSFVDRRGESVKEFKITLDSHALLSLPGGIKFTNDDGVEVDWNIDWDKTNFDNFDITHIKTEMPNGRPNSLKILSAAFASFKFWKWCEDNSLGDLGWPYNSLNYSDFPWPHATTAKNLAKPPNSENTIYINANYRDNQIETEFFDGMNYKTLYNNTWIDNIAPYFSTRDFSDDLKDSSNNIETILPKGPIGETPIETTITYSGNPVIDWPKDKRPILDNANIDLDTWWGTDWKQNRIAPTHDTLAIQLGWYQDSVLKIAVGLPIELKFQFVDIFKNKINNLLTNKTTEFKGIVINPLPDELINQERPSNYSEFTEADRDHYVLSTFNMLKYYNENSAYFEALAPTRTVNLKKYARGSSSDQVNFLSPLSVPLLNIPFLFKQESGIKIEIYGYFNEPIKFPKTYELKFIDGGKFYSIDQYEDMDLTPALDIDGNEVSTISKRTNWYLNKQQNLVRNVGSFISSRIKGIESGYINTDPDYFDKVIKQNQNKK